MLLGRTEFEKNAMLNCKFSKLCNFEFYQIIIAFFSNTVRPRNIKVGIYKVYKKVNT